MNMRASYRFIGMMKNIPGNSRDSKIIRQRKDNRTFGIRALVSRFVSRFKQTVSLGLELKGHLYFRFCLFSSRTLTSVRTTTSTTIIQLQKTTTTQPQHYHCTTTTETLQLQLKLYSYTTLQKHGDLFARRSGAGILRPEPGIHRIRKYDSGRAQHHGRCHDPDPCAAR